MKNQTSETIKTEYMQEALKQALKAAQKDEIPIGAVIVSKGKIIAKAHNLVEKKGNPLCHAEILAIKKASKKYKSWRIENAEMYVTLEPCAMCAGAIVNARIKKVFFGAYEKKSGCATSKYPILSDSGLNHSTEFEGGILQTECEEIIKKYFKSKRIRKNLD